MRNKILKVSLWLLPRPNNNSTHCRWRSNCGPSAPFTDLGHNPVSSYGSRARETVIGPSYTVFGKWESQGLHLRLSDIKVCWYKSPLKKVRRDCHPSPLTSAQENKTAQDRKRTPGDSERPPENSSNMRPHLKVSSSHCS